MRLFPSPLVYAPAAVAVLFFAVAIWVACC